VGLTQARPNEANKGEWKCHQLLNWWYGEIENSEAASTESDYKHWYNHQVSQPKVPPTDGTVSVSHLAATQYEPSLVPNAAYLIVHPLP